MGVVLLAMTLLGGCEAGTATGPGRPGLPDGGSTGTTGGGNTPVVAGTWSTRLVTPVPLDDFLQEDITWEFRTDGSCRQSIESVLYSEGIPRLTVTTCSYTLRQGVVLVRFAGAAEPVGYPFSIPLNDSDTLVLSGIAYGRVP